MGVQVAKDYWECKTEEQGPGAAAGIRRGSSFLPAVAVAKKAAARSSPVVHKGWGDDVTFVYKPPK